MNRRQAVWLTAIVGFVLMAGGCASHVRRIPVDQKVDYSGRWNDTDSQMVADAMIKDCVAQGWQPTFLGDKKRIPIVIVGEIKNQSEEHVNTEVFTKELERSLLNSSKVKFVASKMERVQVRDERNEQQQGETAPETIKRKGRETGADFIMIGSINSVKDQTSGRYVIMYQVNLELVDLENNEKVWLGQHEIKKIVDKSKFSL